uniref:Uncharacterized protein n=1 Tax=Labrus bergylta TaxID=56723 RepID=A0A3Q3EWQ0_9LABR
MIQFRVLIYDKHLYICNLVILTVFFLAFMKGAPRTAVYKFVRCNPEGGQANCVTQQSPEMTWSPELPVKLLASTAQRLFPSRAFVGEAKPEEQELREDHLLQL